MVANLEYLKEIIVVAGTVGLNYRRLAAPPVIKPQTMETRAKIPPGLPPSNPTTSYWQDPPDSIANLRSTDNIPTESDYIVIGSGILGSCIARNILLRRPGAQVLMLEARTACSGATGRNGQL